MECLKCQTKNPEARKFCRECGAKLLLPCPQCGMENFPGDKFCGECGCDLTQPTEAPPIDYKEPQSYTPKFLADKILTNRSTIEGERKLVTVLFADVANYTSISEKLDPEAVHQIMDGCFKILMDEIHKYEGTINQFTGDGVMALFGAPVAHEDHAQRACYAALAIQSAVTAYGERIKRDHGQDFKMRIGLNSGPVIVGAIGDDLRMDYTAIGDTTNLASRMEGMAQPGAIYISSNTQRLARDFFEFKSLGKVEVKGKEDPQEAFELQKTGEVETRIGASVAKGLTRFVGRKNSMAALMEAYEKVKSGSGQVVGLVGEAGVGKSRILFEMRGMLPQGEYSYLEGRCIHFGGSMIYLPILDILRSYFEIKDGDLELTIKKKTEEKIIDFDEKLKGVLPPIHELLSIKVDDDAFNQLEPNEKRERTFEAIRDLLIRVSQEKPLILAVEDLHWIDKTSEEFLGYLIGWLANNPILLLLLYRPEYTHPWGSKSYYNSIVLSHLTTKSSAELVQAILEGADVVPELKDLILHRSGGNPLFMEEFTRSLIENGTIQKKDHQYVLSQKPADIQVPDTIQGIIAARIDRLEDNLKRTMQVASVIGRDFAFRILQTITGMKQELKSHLINLQGLEFIYEKRLFPELEYIFKHILTQEVAYNSLLLKRRKEIHEKIGKAIEDIYTDRLEEFYEMLAYHYSKTENFEKAFQYLKLSGLKAVEKHSLIEALGHYKEAKYAIDQIPISKEIKKEKLQLILFMSLPLRLLGFPEGSLEIFKEGESISNELEDIISTTILEARMAVCYSHQGNHSEGLWYAESAFEKAGKIQNIDLIAPVGLNLCNSYSNSGYFSKMVDVAPDIIKLIEKEKRESDFFNMPMNVYSAFCAYLGIGSGCLGHFKQGETFCEKGLQFALQLGEPRSITYVELWYGLFLAHKGAWEISKAHWKNCIKYSEETNWLFALGLAWLGLGMAFTYLGDPQTGLEYIQKGLKIQSSTGINSQLAYYYCELGNAHFALDDLTNALDCVTNAYKLAYDNNEKLWQAYSSVLLGRILAKSDPSQIDNAEEYILKGINIFEELRIKSWYPIGHLFLGEVYADIGQKDKAIKNLKKSEGMFKEMGMDYWLAKTDEVLAGL
jgi:class 3 adenylate cyclase/tetratricopeptide (TPR) repeat protein